jgi:hypothetical protein
VPYARKPYERKYMKSIQTIAVLCVLSGVLSISSFAYADSVVITNDISVQASTGGAVGATETGTAQGSIDMTTTVNGEVVQDVHGSRSGNGTEPVLLREESIYTQGSAQSKNEGKVSTTPANEVGENGKKEGDEVEYSQAESGEVDIKGRIGDRANEGEEVVYSLAYNDTNITKNERRSSSIAMLFGELLTLLQYYGHSFFSFFVA